MKNVWIVVRSGIVRPHFTADRSVFIVEHSTDHDLIQVRPVVLAAAFFPESRSTTPPLKINQKDMARVFSLSAVIKPLPFQAASNLDIGMIVLASLILIPGECS
ncbi:MAG: hypothetical protein R6V54_13050 [Desulfobacteraceae bacterium]